VSSNKKFCKAEVVAKKADKIVAQAEQRYIIAAGE
jgi:hypothetical protein